MTPPKPSVELEERGRNIIEDMLYYANLEFRCENDWKAAFSLLMSALHSVRQEARREAIEEAACKARRTHKLRHLEECKCKRCVEADKIATAIRKLNEETT